MKKIFTDTYGRVRSGWQILLAIVVMLVAALGQQIPYIFGGNVVPPFVQNVLAGIVYGGLALVLAYVVFKLFFKKQYTGDLDCYSVSVKSLLKLLAGMLVGIVAFTITVVPLYISGVYRVQLNAGVSIETVLSVFVFFCGVGVVEEVVTRGIMQHALLRFGKWPAIAVVSVIFGLLHIANPGVTVNAILGVTLAGIVLGMSLYATNSLMFAIGFHATWNWVQGMIYGIPVSGTVRYGSVLQTEIVSDNALLSGGEFGAEASLSCLIVLVLISVVFYLWGKKNGNLAKYDTDKNLWLVRS